MKFSAPQSYIPFQEHLPRLYIGILAIELLHAVVLVFSNYWGLIPVELMNHTAAISIFIILIGFAYYFYNAQSINLSITIFLIGALIVTSSQVWHGNGLNDPAFTALPGIVMLAALLGNFRNFLSVLIVTLLIALFIGVGSLQQWVPHNKLTSTMDIIGLLSIIVMSGLAIAWYSKDFKRTLNKIHKENENFRESEKAICHLAHHDALTGLLNISTCQTKYYEYFDSVKAGENILILAYIDLDDFKHINDTYSHNTGDQLLVEIARRLNQACEPDDLVCRLGGDEFLLIGLRPQQYPVSQLAQNLLKHLTQPFLTRGVQLDVSVSVGLAIAPQDGVRFDEVRKKADTALFKSKNDGKNTWSFYNEELHQEVQRKASIVSGLREALKTDSLELYFQAKTDLTTGKPIGAEALLRWSGNNPYQIRPDEFIPIIESSSLMVDIGSWVIESACLACKQWHMAGHDEMRVAINVSVMQLLHNNLRPIIEAALAKSGLQASFLEIELTEHLLLSNTKQVAEQLEELKTLGVTLAIDDFGTGYSNLSYLSRFKVDTLKLDRTFINSVTQTKESLDIVTAVLAMAKILGLETVAEGIESVEQWDLLRSLGCDYGQGYLWARPMPNDSFQASLLANAA